MFLVIVYFNVNNIINNILFVILIQIHCCYSRVLSRVPSYPGYWIFLNNNNNLPNRTCNRLIGQNTLQYNKVAVHSSDLNWVLFGMFWNMDFKLKNYNTVLVAQYCNKLFSRYLVAKTIKSWIFLKNYIRIIIQNIFCECECKKWFVCIFSYAILLS